MGLLSDFFIASPIEIESRDLSRSPAGSIPSIQASRVDVVKIVQLQCIIDGSVFNDHLKELDSLIVRSLSDDGPWIISVPKIIEDNLAEADENMVNQYGTAWASTDEWISDGGKPGEIIALTQGIANLSRKARLENRRLFVWVSL